MQRERDALQAQIRQADALERIALALEGLLTFMHPAADTPVVEEPEVNDGTK